MFDKCLSNINLHVTLQHLQLLECLSLLKMLKYCVASATLIVFWYLVQGQASVIK